MRATLDFAIGLINAQLVDGRMMGFTVEGVGETVKSTRESEVPEIAGNISTIVHRDTCQQRRCLDE